MCTVVCRSCTQRNNIFHYHFYFLFFIADPFDCASTIGCASEGWIILDASLNVYVKNAACSDSTPFSSLTELNCKCPVASIAPCSCQPTAGSDTSLTISCANQNLDDTTMASIIANVPPTTPVDTFDFSQNLLTVVPPNLPQFNQLSNLNLSTNAIVAVGTGELNLPAAVNSLDLSSNQISTIAASSLPGNLLHLIVWMTIIFILLIIDKIELKSGIYASGGLINLDSNLLTSFDEVVFGPIIRGFISNDQTGNSISVANSKSIMSL